ncbi:transglutaminase-like cysteine peptidase [Pararhizobium mangrovi]|uniref:Transglutaminase n=1 Tax=Pararhizobium mangrovi TaxID=2590452 RepID=A0A506TXI5_9HYPH|nr:transglutaminase-like cysteine peptidase [Pararhizobium mangrovi]TPW26220.1 transglutaminase [Pararhizobium mangrovi]
MKHGRKLTGILTATLVFLLASPLADAASGRPQAFMTTGSRTSQPIGHYRFCQRHGSECLSHSVDAHPSRLTKSRWNTLVRVNAKVNHEIRPVTDEELYGQEEYWTYPQTAGDCEDYVLLKQYMLERRGFDSSDLLITVVRKPNGEGHAVLTVRTGDGDYVLDNLANTVKRWDRTHYTYLKRQADGDSGQWVKIDTGHEMLVGSVK